MNRFVTLIFTFFVSCAPAPALAHECDPLAVAGGVQVGSSSRTITTEAGSVDVWWCQYVAVDGTYRWRMQRPVDLKDCHDLSLLAGALGRIALMPTYATVEAELRAGAKGCVVQPDTQRHYEVRRLQWLGCKALQDPTAWPAGVTFIRPTAEDPASPSVYSADYCGLAPVPPGTPTADIWWVAKASSAAIPAGTRTAYSYLAGVMVETRPQQRVAQYTLCLPNVPRLKLGTVEWCTFSSSGLWAVAVKKPL